ncbi:MAG: hypothetical protein LJE84_12485 [Gammaproteobacteria bacterium]|nr:hypothetical protein [Gammaproteobacteria bacterium]
MDEDAYRSAYAQHNPQPCVFEKATLSGRCACRYGQRLLLAQREAQACQNSDARGHCVRWLEMLREPCRFALGLTGTAALPHAKEIKVQVGGLRGLRALLAGDEEPGVDPVADVAALLARARGVYESWQQLPLESIVRAVGSYRHRGR